jgi:diaminohydroxyphosphoribosylaminopyrimidine deaminase / 5-amino-6-(5-phosphoribosylamino)uracil reductase
MAEQSAGDESAVARQAQADLSWLRQAIELSRQCPPSETAFSVGAVLVSDAGDVISTGYSRELDPKEHAEEVALAKAGDDPRLARATLYSSLEPCLSRASRPRSCAELIVAAGIPRVVIAWLEPPLFASGGGATMLRGAGIAVDEIPWLAELARSINAHLLPDRSG